MAILGYSTMGAGFDSMGTGRMLVSKFTLASAATLNELHGWFNSNGGTSIIRLVIYKDIDGLNTPRPNATLVAYSNPIALIGTNPVHLQQAGFNVVLPAGAYWIGARSNVSGGFWRGDIIGIGSSGIDGASDPPPSPFGAGSGSQSSSNQLSCWVVVTPSVILGRNTFSGFGQTIGSYERLKVYKATLAAAGHLDELWANVSIAAGALSMRCVLFDDDGASGEPGTLLARGADIAVPVAGSLQVRGGAVVTPINLAAGDYWLGIHEGGGSGGALLQYDDAGSGATRLSGADTFSDGTASPWIAGSSLTGNMQVWGVLSAATAVAPVADFVGVAF